MDEPDIPFDLDGPSTSAQAATAAEEAGRPDEVLAVSGGFDGRKVWLVKVRSSQLGGARCEWSALPGKPSCRILTTCTMSLQVPKFLQERWAQVEEKGKHLATMRVYEQCVPDPAPS